MPPISAAVAMLVFRLPSLAACLADCALKFHAFGLEYYAYVLFCFVWFGSRSILCACIAPTTAFPMAAVNTSFERKDDIRARLRIILRETTAQQKERLLCNVVALPKKGFHCRTRHELLKLDAFLRTHFPAEMSAVLPIGFLHMQRKLEDLDKGGDATGDCPELDSGT
jgi:hypothetical protein